MINRADDLIEQDIQRALDDLFHGLPGAPLSAVKTETVLRQLVQRVRTTTRDTARLGLLSVDEVAERYRVGHSTVTKWCRAGLLHGAESVGVGSRTTWLIPEEALEGFELPKTGWAKRRKRSPAP